MGYKNIAAQPHSWENKKKILKVREKKKRNCYEDTTQN